MIYIMVKTSWTWIRHDVRNDGRFYLVQFTWLLDKNWNEIYEGDIYHQGDSRILYIVEWLDTGLKGRQNWNKSTAWISHFQSDIEVIWNIFESPDLIK